MPGKRLNVKTGRSLLKDEKEAVSELHEAIYQAGTEVVIFFCSSKYNLDRLGSELDRQFDCKLIGCTTAGEISSGGYQDGGIVGASFCSDEIEVHCNIINPLDEFSLSDAAKYASDTLAAFHPLKEFDKEKMFGFLLIDGLSMLEDIAIANLYSSFGGIPILGGSAGEDLSFDKTFIYDRGQFITNAAVFAVFKTSLPFRIFRIQHFQPTETKAVITEAEPKTRIITEINGEPAAAEYARLIGVKTGELNTTVFSEHPFMLKIGGEWYVRSIQKNNSDYSLSMFSAIEEGLVLTIGKGVDIVKNLKEQMTMVEEDFPRNRFYLLCDCILRKQELNALGLIDDINELIKDMNSIGFSTYGEQYHSIHVNQTLTGLIVGE